MDQGKLLFVSVVLGFLSILSLIGGGHTFYQGMVLPDVGALIVGFFMIMLAFMIANLAWAALDVYREEKEVYENELKKEKLYKKWMEYK